MGGHGFRMFALGRRGTRTIPVFALIALSSHGLDDLFVVSRLELLTRLGDIRAARDFRDSRRRFDMLISV